MKGFNSVLISGTVVHGDDGVSRLLTGNMAIPLISEDDLPDDRIRVIGKLSQSAKLGLHIKVNYFVKEVPSCATK